MNFLHKHHVTDKAEQTQRKNRPQIRRCWRQIALLGVFASLVAQLGWAQAPRKLRRVAVGPPIVMPTRHGVKLRPREAMADRLLVRLTPTVQPQQWTQALGRVGGRFGKALGEGLYIVELPEGSDLVQAATILRLQPGIWSAEPDLVIYPALVPNDPQYSQQYYLPLIHAPEAWGITTGASSVVVAVIDSGVDINQPDLQANKWINTKEIPNNNKDDDHNGLVDDYYGWDFYNDNNDPRPAPNGRDENLDGEPDEQVNHGTLVAGLIAAVGNNNWGVAGVSWRTRIMPLQVFPDDGGGYVSDVIEAINYAIDQGAQIINLSMGGDYVEAFTAPINRAYNAGVLVVSAGGNTGKEFTASRSTWESPVCNDGDNPLVENHVLGVGATDRNDQRTYYSNIDGSGAHFIDIMAPGDNIYGLAAYFPTFPAFRTYFTQNSGTSFSAPIVTGLAALLKARTPAMTPAELIAAICHNGDNIDPVNPGLEGKLGGGRVNCARALGVAVPPAPPLNLSAADTPGDDGGSITLTWTKSPDDGGGANSVIAYEVWRRAGASGNFQKIATLPPGTQRYVDNTVTDGVDYYYKLRTTDGTLSSETTIVGPVQSRNDKPPERVRNLRAMDRPNDNGGAIVLSWDAYTAPADFAAFAIYRSNRMFTNTTGMTPIALLTDSRRTSYTDTGVSDGLDYYYVVGVRDTAGNEIRALSAVGPVQAFPNTPVTLEPGLYFIALPAIPPEGDPAALFGLPAGSFGWARYLPAENRYVLDGGQRPLPDLLQLGLGRGYWLQLPTRVSFNPVGQTAPSGDFPVALTPGWNQIGNPFFSAFDFGEATVSDGNTTMDLMSAHGAGIMAAFAWIYNTGTESYELVYPPISGARKLVQPWQGIWVLAFRNCQLMLTRPLATQQERNVAVAEKKQEAWRAEWVITLRVQSGAGGGGSCLIGTAAQEIVAAQPPPPGPRMQLTVSAPGREGRGEYGVSLALRSSHSAVWTLTVRGLRPGVPVRLSAPDLSTLPADKIALLEDLASGQNVYLRTTTAYLFTPREGEAERRLRLTIMPRPAGGLAVQGMAAQAVCQGGAAICFTLSQPAACTVTIRNIAGRPIRVIEEGRVRPAGNQTVLWDGRSVLGTKAPGGVYLVEVQASGTSGEHVRALTTLRLAP